MPSEVGSIDIAGDLPSLIQEVIEEMIEIYDITYNTFVETFTDPLSAREASAILTQLDATSLLAMMVESPAQARDMLREARKLGE